MRVHVKPAHPAATIPDLEHGDALPADGREVEWSAHWARLAMREDVIVTPIEEPVEAPAAEVVGEPAPADQVEHPPAV